MTERKVPYPDGTWVVSGHVREGQGFMVSAVVHAKWLKSRVRKPAPPGPAALLRAHRERKGLSLTAVAARCRIDLSDLSRLERGLLSEGRSILSRHMIEEFAKGCDLSPDEIAPVLIAGGFIPTGYRCEKIDSNDSDA